MGACCLASPGEPALAATPSNNCGKDLRLPEQRLGLRRELLQAGVHPPTAATPENRTAAAAPAPAPRGARALRGAPAASTNCPGDGMAGRGSAGRRSATGKTCGCPSGDVKYGGSCCAPRTAQATSGRGGMADGCDKACRLREGERALQRRLLRMSTCTGDVSGSEMLECLWHMRNTFGRVTEVPSAGGTTASRPARTMVEQTARQKQLRWHLRLRQRRDLHERPLSGQDLHPDLRLRADLFLRQCACDPVQIRTSNFR